MKRTIRLTENDLHRIVMESVQQVIRESGETPEGQRKLGAAAARRWKRSLDPNNPNFKEDWKYCDRIQGHAKRNKAYDNGKLFGWDDDFSNGWDEYVGDNN